MLTLPELDLADHLQILNIDSPHKMMRSLFWEHFFNRLIIKRNEFFEFTQKSVGNIDNFEDDFNNLLMVRPFSRMHGYNKLDELWHNNLFFIYFNDSLNWESSGQLNHPSEDAILGYCYSLSSAVLSSLGFQNLNSFIY